MLNYELFALYYIPNNTCMFGNHLAKCGSQFCVPRTKITVPFLGESQPARHWAPRLLDLCTSMCKSNDL